MYALLYILGTAAKDANPLSLHLNGYVFLPCGQYEISPPQYVHFIAVSEPGENLKPNTNVSASCWQVKPSLSNPTTYATQRTLCCVVYGDTFHKNLYMAGIRELRFSFVKSFSLCCVVYGDTFHKNLYMAGIRELRFSFVKSFSTEIGR